MPTRRAIRIIVDGEAVSMLRAAPVAVGALAHPARTEQRAGTPLGPAAAPALIFGPEPVRRWVGPTASGIGHALVESLALAFTTWRVMTTRLWREIIEIDSWPLNFSIEVPWDNGQFFNLAVPSFQIFLSGLSEKSH